MRSIVLFSLILASALAAEELFITKTSNDFVIEGNVQTSGLEELIDQEFWICVDYEASTPIIRPSRPYPTKACGGNPASTRNTYWYAAHGQFEAGGRLSIKFESATLIWPESGREYPGRPYTWTSNAFTDAAVKNGTLRIIQSHGIRNDGAKDLAVDKADLFGFGSVHVRGVNDAADLHVRVQGAGFTLQQAYETENARETEEKPESTTPESLEAVEEMPADGQDGVVAVRFRPSFNIPVFEYVEPASVYDDDSVRGWARVPDDSEGEIAEIPADEQKATDPPTTTIIAEIKRGEAEITSPPVTTLEAQVETNEVDDWATVDALMSESPSDYQMVYTAAMAAAVAFLLCFVCIVLFRCMTYPKTDKLGDLPTAHPPRPVVYTIGSDVQQGNAQP
ncbi:hypothetical protein M3Y99_00756800 [Aphelenchoides fujianensis]|nr:hypothetical protein M3Y99_00756800 [Aphelenchoides fujianensis]